MASDNTKGQTVGLAAGTKKGRTQASASKSSLKQKTLLDSFFTKVPKVIPVDDQPGVIVIDEGANSLVVPEDAVTATSEPISTSLPETEVKDALVPVEIVDNDSPTSSVVELPSAADALITQEKSASVVSDNVPERSRSPSIVMLEDPIIPARSQKLFARSNGNGEGKTPDQPILIESSPPKGPSATLKPDKPIHPFFIAKAKAAPPSLPSVRKKAPKSNESLTPVYPDASSQHVKGPQTTTPHIAQTIFSKRTSLPPQHITEKPSNYEFLKRGTSVVDKPTLSHIPSLSANAPEVPSLNIPPEHEANHPAIARLLQDNPRDFFVSRRPWTEKWRPSCAAEVLGNEESAMYLRNWLRALELQLEESATSSSADAQKPDPAKGKAKAVQRGTKRARIVRAVEKQRKRSRIDSDEEDDWIVRTDDETDEEIPLDQDMDEFGDLLPELPASSPSSSVPDTDTLPSQLADGPKLHSVPDLGQLHNTILLVGPHGCGKTASVYACAEELGWEVFEVWPGIGRRNGPTVDNLVGEVGKNHLVLQNRQPEDIVKSFARQKSRLGTPEPLVGSDYSPRKRATSTATPEPGNMSIVEAKPIRQSLILLEEVDILFKGDTNFWATVTRIIKDCKRPVVCTCNDLSLIPVGDLPLQTILQIDPCQPDVVVSYLQAICSAEGYEVKPDLLGALYSGSHQEQEFLNPFLAGAPRLPDLRRTINTLQILCGATNRSESPMSTNINGANASGEGTSSLRQCALSTSRISVKRSEFFSYLDCALKQDSLHNFTDAEFAGYLPSEDDEIGHVILHDQYVRGATHYGLNDRHEDMLTSTVRLSRGVFDMDVRADALETQAFEETIKKAAYEQRTALREVCPMGVWTRQDGSVRLDYIPAIRQIVEAEDAQEALEMEKRTRTRGRNTRNSARSGYVRIMDLTEDGRRVLVGSGL